MIRTAAQSLDGARQDEQFLGPGRAGQRHSDHEQAHAEEEGQGMASPVGPEPGGDVGEQAGDEEGRKAHAVQVERVEVLGDGGHHGADGHALEGDQRDDEQYAKGRRTVFGTEDPRGVYGVSSVFGAVTCQG